MSIFKAHSSPSGSVEKRSGWQSPGTAGSWPQLGAAQSSGQPQDPGGRKARQMLYITTNKSTYIASPRWNAPDSSLAVFLLLTPAGHSLRWHKSQLVDTTYLSCWHAKVVLWRSSIRKGWLSSGPYLSWDSRGEKKSFQTVSANKRQRVVQSHLCWSWVHSAAPLEMPKWPSWWFSTPCTLALKQCSCARQQASRLKL